LAEYLALKLEDLTRLRAHKKEPSIHSVGSLAQSIPLSIDAIYKGRIDYKALAEHHFGNKQHLPERYTSGATTSRLRTAINVLDYVHHHYGWERRQRLLSRFQMNEVLLSDPESLINIRFSIDLTTAIYQQNRNSFELEKIGAFSTVTHSKSIIGERMRLARSIPELYEIMLSELLEKHVEQNYAWVLEKMTPTHCLIKGTPKDGVTATVGAEFLRNPLACRLRLGFFAAIPGYLQLPSAETHEVSCVNRGDPACRYSVDFSRCKPHQMSPGSFLS
jgi:hypothetical protein